MPQELGETGQENSPLWTLASFLRCGEVGPDLHGCSLDMRGPPEPLSSRCWGAGRKSDRPAIPSPPGAKLPARFRRSSGLAGASQFACGSATAIHVSWSGSPPVNPRLLRPEVELLPPPQCFRVKMKSDNICESTSTLGVLDWRCPGSLLTAEAGRVHPAMGRLLVHSSLYSVVLWCGRGPGEAVVHSGRKTLHHSLSR